MNILFLGSYVPKEYEYRFKNISAAANQYQNNLVAVLKKKHIVDSMSYITAPEVNPTEEEEAVCKSQRCNLYLAKRDGAKSFLNFRKDLKAKIKWADFVITYNMVYAWFGIGLLAKNYHTKSILILADYTPWEEEKVVLKKIYAFFSKVNFNKFDKAVILSEGSRKYVMGVPEVSVINGAVDMSLFQRIEPIGNSHPQLIVYTGFLGRITGVDLLIEAFKTIENDNIRLVLCGQGDELKEYILKSCMADSRIECRGYVSKEEYLQILNDSYILVNPRNMNYRQNKNNFPSKVLEYLATGRIIVSTKFCGYETFENNIFFVDSDVNSIRVKIIELLNLNRTICNNIYITNRRKASELDWEQLMLDLLQ